MGSTAEQVQALNHEWLAFVNSQVKGGGVRSFMLTNIVGAVAGFRFADSYPDLEARTAAKPVLQTKEGQVAEEGLSAAADCAINSPGRMQES